MKETTTKRRGRPRKQRKPEPEPEPAHIIKFPLWDLCRHRKAFNRIGSDENASHSGMDLASKLYHENFYQDHESYMSDWRLFNLAGEEKRAVSRGLELCTAIEPFYLANLARDPEVLEPEELESIHW